MRTLLQKTPLVLITIILSVWFLSPATAKARAAALPVPALTAAVQANPAVLLNWTLPFKASISGFKIERSLDPLSGYAVIATAGRSATSYNDASVEQGKGYYYRVRSYKSSTYSEYSDIAYADVPPAVVVDSIPPTVSITSPSSGVSYSTAQTVSITASAQDNVGVSKVEFYHGGVLKKTATAAPYQHDWAVTSADNGSHNFTAKAYDAKGNVASSAAVAVAVNIQTVPAEYTAPVLNSVTVNGSDMVLAWSLPQTSYGTPAGGYDIFTDGVDDNLHHTGLTATKSGLQQGVEHCFTVEARWTQAVPAVFPASNQVCKVLPLPVDTTKPTIAITSPAAGTSVTTAQTLTVNANAQDNVGVSKVEFYNGATLLLTDTTAPYSYDWVVTAANNGSHSFTAKAYDAAGNVTGSPAVSVSVNIPVVVATYTAPVLESVKASGTDMVLTWSLPSTAYGTPAGGYDIFTDGVDDNLHHTTLTAVKSGLQQGVEHCFVVEARWTQAVPGVFPASNQVCALLPDVTMPSVTITSPAVATTVTTAQTLTIAATAQDNIGISKVEFYDGTVLKATDTVAPYSFDWAVTEASNGTHSITARAYDAAGNVASSTAVSVSVNIQTVPAEYTAPVLNSVTVNGSDMVLAWSLPQTSYGTPAGGYDIFTDGVDDNLHHTGLTATKSGLQQGVEHCFTVEARWTQAVPAVFPASNQVCKVLPLPVDTTKPTIAITSPAAGTSVTTAQTLTVNANAQDNVGVSKVEFYNGATLLLTDTTAPYSYDWVVTAANNGSHSFTAKAYDAAGNVASSTAVSVSVNIQTVPAEYTAPVLNYVQVSGSDFLLGWTQPASAYGAPEGGYDIFIDNTDTGTTNRTVQQTAVISGLAAGNHCFEIEARWTQANPAVYLFSNQLCATSESTQAPQPPPGPMKVFPGAAGFGTDSPAGRGGSIIKVTNLNDSGAGSLREAVSASGPRVVVFEVSGRINLQSTLTISNPYITIAGQTAPSPGIQVAGRTVKIATHDVLIQHLRFRVGDEGKFRDGSWDSTDALQITGSSAYNIVVDHVTANWSIDDIFDVTNKAHDVSLLDSIIAEPLNNSVHSKGSHGYISLVAYDVHKIFYARNLIGSGISRLPLFKDSSFGLFNNLFYNTSSTEFTACAPLNEVPGVVTRASIVNNSYKDGPSGTANYAIAIGSGTPAGSEFLISGNTYDGGSLRSGGSSYIVNTAPVNTWPEGFTPMPESSVKSYVLSNVGARPIDRDAVEKRLVNQVSSLTGQIINSQTEVGGFPIYPVNYRAFDAGTNPNGDDDGDGYTNVEEILYRMALQVEGKL